MTHRSGSAWYYPDFAHELWATKRGDAYTLIVVTHPAIDHPLFSVVAFDGRHPTVVEQAVWFVGNYSEYCSDIQRHHGLDPALLTWHCTPEVLP